MQIIKSLTKLLVFICPVFATAQTTYIPQGDKAYDFIDRLQIKYQTNTNLLFPGLKSFSRKSAVKEIEFLDSAATGFNKSAITENSSDKGLALTSIDRYNLNSFLMNNTEWVSGSKESFMSRKPVLKNFYVTKPNLLEVNTKDFF